MITLYGGDVVVLSRDDVRGRPTGEIKLHHLIGIQATILEKANIVVLIEENGDARYLKDRWDHHLKQQKVVGG